MSKRVADGFIEGGIDQSQPTNSSIGPPKVHIYHPNNEDSSEPMTESNFETEEVATVHSALRAVAPSVNP